MKVLNIYLIIFKSIFKIPENLVSSKSPRTPKKYFFNIKEYTVAKHSSINCIWKASTSCYIVPFVFLAGKRKLVHVLPTRLDIRDPRDSVPLLARSASRTWILCLMCVTKRSFSLRQKYLSSPQPSWTALQTESRTTWQCNLIVSSSLLTTACTIKLLTFVRHECVWKLSKILRGYYAC